MSKIPTSLMNSFNDTYKVYKHSKSEHNKNIDKIIEIIKPIIAEKYQKNNVRWNIEKVKFHYDEYISNNTSKEYEWLKISEDEYDENSKKSYYNKNNLKTEYVYDEKIDTWKECFFKLIKKRHKYFRVHVYETWGYGGYENVTYDFPLSDIVEESYFRKEKLKKLEE